MIQAEQKEQVREYIARTKLFVLDMDGTYYLGDQMIPGSLDFLRKTVESGREYLFFTNNSSRTSQDYIDKLAGMGTRIRPDQIMTSGDVTISYLNTHYKGSSVYLVGTETLKDSFKKAGIRLVEEEQPDIAVCAFDTTLDYEKLTRICDDVRNGALFLATHPDINCPTQTGFIPDCGSFCAAITLSTGEQPRFLGKPYAETAEMIRLRTGYRAEEIAFVGDRLYTDIATGVNNGSMGFLVLSGETKREEITSSPVKPDAVFENLAEIASYL